RMVRTLDGNARAFLSDRYRRIDNEDVAEMALPVLMDVPDLQVASAEVTERKLYIKAVFPRVQGEVKTGDVVQSGVVISNSEIGLGSISVQHLVFRLVCSNGMIAPDSGIKRNHVGRRIESGELSISYQEDTLQADDRALSLKLRDSIIAATSAEGFESILERMREATTGPLLGDPVAAVELARSRFGMNEREGRGVLEALIRGGDYSRFGMLNAITDTAKADFVDYDRATELESLGGSMLDVQPGEWKDLVEATA
ncbi:MAG: DUF932 domain-containing protein, partial [Rhodospirillaceae bacterium]|nr:DUF932 domain-containing protein [Rhodospirillaceae bacterium]